MPVISKRLLYNLLRGSNVPRLLGIGTHDGVGDVPEDVALDKNLSAHARVDGGLHAEICVSCHPT